MKTILAILLAFFWIQTFAQTGTITGTVTTSEHKPAEFINIILQGTGKGAISDDKGNYSIENVPVGPYTLIASFVGLETQKIPVTSKKFVKTGLSTTKGCGFNPDFC